MSGPPVALARLQESLDALSLFVKAPPPAGSAAAAASLLAADFKAANRAACLCVEEARARVSEASAAADARLLSLQNLQYERSHLAREIQKCRDFPTPHLSALMPLLPAEAAPQPAGGGEHAAMLARLAAERVARGEEEAGAEEARGRLLALRSSARARAAFLEGLPAVVGAVEAALAPAEAGLALPPAPRAARYARTLGLPGPLYVLYSQLEAAAELLAAEAAEGGGGALAGGARAVGVDVVAAFAGGAAAAAGEGDARTFAVPAARLRLHAAALGLEAAGGGGGGGGGAPGAAPLKRGRGSEEALAGAAAGEEEGSDALGPGLARVALPDLLRAHPKAVLLALRLPEGEGGAEEGGMAAEGAPGRFAALRFEYLPLLDLVTVAVCGEKSSPAALSAAAAALREGGSGSGSGRAPAPAPHLPPHCLIDLLCGGDDGALPAAWLGALAGGGSGGAPPPPMPAPPPGGGLPLWWAQAPAGLCAPPPPCPRAPRAPPSVAALLGALARRLAGASAAGAAVAALSPAARGGGGGAPPPPAPAPPQLAPLLPAAAAPLLLGGGGRGGCEWAAARCERAGALCSLSAAALARAGGAPLAAARGALPALVAALRALGAPAPAPPAALTLLEELPAAAAGGHFFGGAPLPAGARALRALFAPAAAGAPRVQLLLRLLPTFPHGCCVEAAFASAAPAGGRAGGAPAPPPPALERLAALLRVAAAALFCPPAPEPAAPLLPCLLAGVGALLPALLGKTLTLPPWEPEEGAFISPDVL
jgi:hypothetical protein